MPSIPVVAAYSLLACVCLAQEPSKPSFDVVSIRPASGQFTILPNGTGVLGAMQGGPGSTDPELLRGTGVTVFNLLSRAYGRLKRYQVSGPLWITTTRFDVAAKIPPGTTKDQVGLMLQRMLEERFRLMAHHEMREFPAYNLVTAKGGLKLRESIPTDACAMGARPAGGSCPDVSYRAGIARSAGNGPPMALSGGQGSARHISGRAATFTTLTNMLEGQLGGPIVIDETGLMGAYDFRLDFAAPNGNPGDDVPFPSLFAALEQDFGLKLQSTKTKVDVLVIDHVEPPSEN